MKKGCLFIILLILAIGIGGYFYFNSAYNSNINSKVEIDTPFSIEEGETLTQVLTRLEEEGLIKSKLLTQIYLKRENKEIVIKTGDFAIPEQANLDDILTLFEKGTLRKGIQVTFKEGLRYEEVISELEENLTNFNSAEFRTIIINPGNFTFQPEIQAFLDQVKPSSATLEGFLYPDTYEFLDTETSIEIVEKFLENFQFKMESELDINALNLDQSNINNIYDALILASIIEREASKIDDRTEISAVFHNRLENGIALQSDATVNYVTGKSDPGVLISDTQIDSPYNTYLYTGLPPAPINSPRLESIIAALYPASSEYIFFFHDDAGNTYFSETLEEHYRKVEEIRGFI